MIGYTLRLSDEPVVALPTDLARQAGLQEGIVQVTLGDHGLTVTPPPTETDYAARWKAMAMTLREQAAQFNVTLEDRRDASYWEIVNPLFEEADRMIGSA